MGPRKRFRNAHATAFAATESPPIHRWERVFEVSSPVRHRSTAGSASSAVLKTDDAFKIAGLVIVADELLCRGSLAPMNSDLPATGTGPSLELLVPFVPDDFINEGWPHGHPGGRHYQHTCAQLFRVHLLCLRSPVHSVNLLVKMLPEQRAWRKFARLPRQSRVRMIVRVRRSAAGRAASPTSRFGQQFTTSTSGLFAPDFTHWLMSTRKGGAQTMPQGWPLMRTSASSRTEPRSRTTGDGGLRIEDGGRSKVFSKVAVPEQSLMSGSGRSVQLASFSNVADAGPLQFASKRTVQGPARSAIALLAAVDDASGQHWEERFRMVIASLAELCHERGRPVPWPSSHRGRA